MLDKKYIFSEKEQKWQDFWKENNIYKFEENSKKPVYAIDTPPPTVSGSNIHIGHAFSYTHIDVVARHKRMQGFNVYFPFGFDTNGLPTSRFVEKKYNIVSGTMSRADFMEKCIEETQNLTPVYKAFYKKVGYSANLENCYSTIEPEQQKISQLSFLELVKKNEVVRKENGTLWCPECKTAIASSETESTEKKSFMNYTFFTDKEGNRLNIATTRPELLCACVCVFVHPDDAERKQFVGKKVFSPIYNTEVPVLTNPDVALDKGTGAVMCCTFGDEADMQWQKTYNLPIKEAITADGKMTELAGEFAGLTVEKCREEIIKKLDELGLLTKQEEITHIVSTHERCGHDVEILCKKQWFINLLKHQKAIRQAGEKVKWHPATMQKRFLNWVDGLKWDWCISRQNFFGIPFPVWYCKGCGKIKLANPEELPVDPLNVQPKTPCDGCGCTEFEPEKDVMDTWATSSLTPQIGMNLHTKKGLDGSFLPMDLRPTAHDNIRVWNFYTIAKSLLHFNKLPWKNVMISGYMVDAHGDKISKSKGNAKETPQELIEKHSADVLRYFTCNMSLGHDAIFSDEGFINGTKLAQKLWNASKFVISFKEGVPTSMPKNMQPMDLWILECLKETQIAFLKQMDKYEVGLALKEVEKLFWNFCDNYIEIAKNRLYKPEIYGVDAKQSAQYAALFVLKEMLKMFSLYMPHITEEIYADTFAADDGVISINQTTYNLLDGALDEKLVAAGKEVVEIVSEARSVKSQNSVSLKTPIKQMAILGYGKFAEECRIDIKAVTNANAMEFFESEEKAVKVVLDLEAQNEQN